MDLNNIIQKTMVEYHHSRIIRLPLSRFYCNCKWAFHSRTTEQSTISAAPTPMQCLKTARQRRGTTPGQRRINTIPSKLEQLPFELLLPIFENIDIASLMAVASTNSKLRHLVRSMPAMAKILQEPFAADALVRMLKYGIARNFAIPDFMRAFQSSSCGVRQSIHCSKTEAFAHYICLLRCRRICRPCEKQEREIHFLPLDMAINCFALDLRNDSCVSGIGGVYAIEEIQRDWTDMEQCCVSRSVDVISMDAAMRLAVIQHGGHEGELQPIKKLVENYVTSQIVGSTVRGVMLPIRIAEGLEVRGFAETVRLAWEKKGLRFDVVRRSMLASVPYLHPKRHPAYTEAGFTCQGCGKNLHVDPASVFWGDEHLAKVYLREQVIDHVAGCETARRTAAGEVLTFDQEQELVQDLLTTGRKYWPKKDSAPQFIQDLPKLEVSEFGLTASQFMLWHSQSVKDITEAGEAVDVARSQA